VDPAVPGLHHGLVHAGDHVGIGDHLAGRGDEAGTGLLLAALDRGAVDLHHGLAGPGERGRVHALGGRLLGREQQRVQLTDAGGAVDRLPGLGHGGADGVGGALVDGAQHRRGRDLLGDPGDAELAHERGEQGDDQRRHGHLEDRSPDPVEGAEAHPVGDRGQGPAEGPADHLAHDEQDQDGHQDRAQPVLGPHLGADGGGRPQRGERPGHEAGQGEQGVEEAAPEPVEQVAQQHDPQQEVEQVEGQGHRLPRGAGRAGGEPPA
jgi:hypothetical protein